MLVLSGLSKKSQLRTIGVYAFTHTFSIPRGGKTKLSVSTSCPVTCNAWNSPTDKVLLTYGMADDSKVSLLIPSTMWAVNQSSNKGSLMVITIKGYIKDDYIARLPQGVLGSCLVKAFLPSSSSPTANDIIEVPGQVEYYQNTGIIIRPNYLNYKHFYGIGGTKISGTNVGLVNNVIITFNPLTTPEAARTCPYQVDVDLDSSIYPTTTTTKTYSLTANCGAWVTYQQTITITFEQFKESNKIKNGASVNTPITLSELSFICTKLGNIKGGLFYTIFPSPRYAFRELKAKGILPQNADPDEKPSGRDVVAVFNGCIPSEQEEGL